MSPRFLQACFVLAVPDVEATARYFVDVLGFSPLAIDAPGWRFVTCGRVRVDLGQCPDATPARELGDHSYFARIFVDDVDAYHRQVSTRGGTVLAPPSNRPWGLREMQISTPDGHRVVFCTVIETSTG